MFLALFEYAVLLYLKNMKGVQKKIFKAGILVVTPSKNPDDCWGNQQTEGLENKLKVLLCFIWFTNMYFYNSIDKSNDMSNGMTTV